MEHVEGEMSVENGRNESLYSAHLAALVGLESGVVFSNSSAEQRSEIQREDCISAIVCVHPIN